MKNSEKHHESEKSKKKSVQKLSLNASKILINQWVQIEQSSENNNSEKVSTKINEFSEKFNDKLKLLKMKQKKIKEQMKATSF